MEKLLNVIKWKKYLMEERKIKKKVNFLYPAKK